MSPPDPPQGGISTREAAAILGTSTSDVLRRIRAGTLRAERFERPGGTYYRVYLDPPQDAPDARQEPPEPRQDASALSEKLLETVLAQAETIADLRERAGRAEERAIAADRRADRAERDHAEARALVSHLADELARARAEQARPWWRKALGLPPA